MRFHTCTESFSKDLTVGSGNCFFLRIAVVCLFHWSAKERISSSSWWSMPARPGSIVTSSSLWPWICHQAPVKKEDSPGDLEKAQRLVNIHETQDKLRINSGFTMDLPCAVSVAGEPNSDCHTKCNTVKGRRPFCNAGVAVAKPQGSCPMGNP